MKKFIFSAAIALAAIGGISAYNGARSNSEPLNDLAIANIDALSRSEIGSKCGGCSSSNTGRYCCTIKFAGTDICVDVY